jgi:hypothetical protein
LNTQTKTLHFFVDDMQLSQCITNINTTPLSFGISAWKSRSSSVEIISFLLLKNASVNTNIYCDEYDWAREEEEDLSSVNCSSSSEVDSDDN